MYLLYLDASGTAELKDTDTTHYVLTGVCIHEGTWFALEKRLGQLKSRYEHGGHQIELHAKDICTLYREQEKIANFESLTPAARRVETMKNFNAGLRKRSGPEKARYKMAMRARLALTHLTRKERSSLYEEALDIIGSHGDLRIFTEAIDKKNLLLESGQRSPVEAAFEQVSSRFNAFIERDNQRHRLKNKGMMVLDNDPVNETMIRRLFAHYRSQGHRWGEMNNIIDVPLFVDSKICSGIQAADLCSYAIRRYVETVDNERSDGINHEEKQLKRIAPRFDRGGGKLHGVRHFTPSSCVCLICLERRKTRRSRQWRLRERKEA